MYGKFYFTLPHVFHLLYRSIIRLKWNWQRSFQQAWLAPFNLQVLGLVWEWCWNFGIIFMQDQTKHTTCSFSLKVLFCKNIHKKFETFIFRKWHIPACIFKQASWNSVHYICHGGLVSDFNTFSLDFHNIKSILFTVPFRTEKIKMKRFYYGNNRINWPQSVEFNSPKLIKES